MGTYLGISLTKSPTFFLLGIHYTNITQGILSTGNIMPIPSYRKLMRAAGPNIFLYARKGIISPVDNMPRVIFVFYHYANNKYNYILTRVSESWLGSWYWKIYPCNIIHQIIILKI